MDSHNASLKGFKTILNNVFVNRDEQLKAISGEFSAVLNGGMGLVAVAGKPGIGKTYFVEHAVKELKTSTFIYGKSKQSRDSALASVSEVINSITDHLLTLPSNTLDIIRQELLKKVSDDIALLAAISPKITSFVNVSRRSGAEDFNRLKYRVKNAVYKYIDIASKYLPPLIIYIDDIQWADSLSLEIIKMLVIKKQGLNILLILSYRDNETTTAMSALITILESKSRMLKLKPLDTADVKEYIDIVFGGRINNAGGLASLIQGLTLGNPFYVKETILILLQENIIKYSEAKKTWGIKINRLNDFFINGDVEKVLMSRIAQDEDFSLLEIIACFDGKVDYGFLKLLINTDEEALKTKLKKLIDAAILLKQEQDGRLVFLFTHDIIYKLVLNSLSAEQKQSVHYRIANSLFSGISEGIDKKGSIITPHLMRADREEVCSEADKWMALVFEAGKEEKQKASIEEALKVFEMCADLLRCSSGKNENIYLKLHLELAECQNLSGRQHESQQIISELTERFRDKESRLAINRKKLYLYYYQREHKETLQTGAAILKDLKFGFGRYRLVCDLLISRIIYSSKKIESLSEAAAAVDEKLSIVLDTLTLMNACAAVSDEKLTAPIGLSAALASAKHGKSANSLVGYVSYAYILYTVWNDLKRTKLMVSQILKMSERIHDPSSKSMVFFMIGAFLSHWSVSIDETDNYLQMGVEYGDLSGDFLFLGHCITTSLDTKAFMGRSLSRVSEYINDCRIKYAETEQYATTYNFDAHSDHIDKLKHGGSDRGYENIGSKYPKLTPFEKLTETALKMERLFMLGRLKESFELVQNAAPHIKSVKGLICRQSIIFYSLLTRIGIHDSLDRSKQTVNKLMIKRFLKELGRFAELNENSFGCYYTLAKAEYNAYIREQQGGLYDRAAEMAEAQKNYKIAALANLLAAKRHNNSEKLRRLYVFESCRLYKLWGADFVCRHIEKEYGFIDGLYYKTNKLLLSSATRTKQELLHGFAKDSLGKSEDEVSSLFLTALIEAGIADYCCVVKREPGGLYLKHQMDKEGSARSYTERVNIKNLSRLPHRMLRYSLRTQEEVCVYPGREKKAFAADARIQSSPDTFFACVPIINCGITTGLLYIENSRAALDAQTLSEIKNLMPLLAVSFSAINGVDIKAMFEPAKKQTLLTNREMDILKLIEKGLSNEGISTELKLAIGTVKKHVSSILNKLGAENRIQAINIAKDKKVL